MAKQDLQTKMKDVKLPVHFYFGDRDWMDSTGAK